MRTSRLSSDRLWLHRLVTAASIAFLAAAGPAAADWRGETGTFRIGFVEHPDRDQMPAERKLAAAALSDQIGMPVAFVPFRSYASMIDAQAGSRIEYAIYSATAYGAASAICKCLVPLAAPVAEDGSGALMAIAVTTNEAINTADDIPAGRLAWVKGGAGAPDAIIETQFTVAGKPVSGEEPYAVMVDDPTAAIGALVSGEVDVMLGWARADAQAEPVATSGTLAALSLAGMSYRMIWTSKPLRFGPHAVRKDVPAEIRDGLIEFLTVRLRQSPDIAEIMDERFSGRFEPATEADYAMATDYAEVLRRK